MIAEGAIGHLSPRTNRAVLDSIAVGGSSLPARVELAKGVGIVAGLAFLSRVLGFVREAAMAAVFGAGAAADAYVVAQTVPMLVLAVVGSALSITFVSVLSWAWETQGRGMAFRLTTIAMNWTLLVTVALVALGEAFAAQLVQIVAPGFSEPVRILTIQMTRVALPMIVFQSLFGLSSALLQTGGQFTFPALADVGFNAIMILAILELGVRFGVHAVAVATTLATGAQLLLQVPALLRMGYRWQPLVEPLGHPALRHVAHLAWPVLLASGVGQLTTVVDRLLASNLPSGAIAALNYANRLMLLVPGLLAAPIATVVYPTLARLAAARDWDGFGRTLVDASRLTSFIVIPVATGMALLRLPLVRLILERGAFDPKATEATAWALLFYSVGLVAFALRDIVIRGCLALQSAGFVMVTSAATTVVNVLLSFLLVRDLKQGGLALAASLASVVGVALLFWGLYGKLTLLQGRPMESDGARACRVGRAKQSYLAGFFDCVWRVSLASGMSGVCLWFVHSLLGSRVPGVDVFHQVIRLASSCGIAAICYMVVTWLLGVREARVIVRVVSASGRRGWGWARGGGKELGKA